MVAVNRAEIVTKILLTSGPQDLTLIPPDVLAVTLKAEKIIQLISVFNKADQCLGIVSVWTDSSLPLQIYCFLRYKL